MDRIDLPADLLANAPSGSHQDPHVVRYSALRILQAFDQFYDDYCQIPLKARAAFEQRDHVTSLQLSQQRLKMYSSSISALGPNLKSLLPKDTETETFWGDVEIDYLELIKGRYEADLAHAYLHSFCRAMHRVEWEPVEYQISTPTPPLSTSDAAIVEENGIFRRFDIQSGITLGLVEKILALPQFSEHATWDQTSLVGAHARLKKITLQINDLLSDNNAEYPATNLESNTIEPIAIDMIHAGFYRNRGSYLVGRIVLNDDQVVPLIFALLNSKRGIYIDAIITNSADAHNLFSSTLANFHVTSNYYHELCEFLYNIMPGRPLGLHYSTIGYNHFGKVAVINELRGELSANNKTLTHAIGNQGTVAIGFASPKSAYNLKVIRNHPTALYKWGEFKGIESVLSKYRRVHEINRTGSMLDNIIYYDVKLKVDQFDPDLLSLLLDEASNTVSRDDGSVRFQHLIVQRRMTPLPVFLQSASDEEAQAAINNLGFCIKNNAAANIFNKDLDARNYGVSRFLKVYLYDYDALEPFTDVKLHTNLGREDGEDDVPDWYFEDGVVFLPEEIESGLMLEHRDDRRAFRDLHGDLLDLAWWQSVQQDLISGKVPAIRVYPEKHELAKGQRAGLIEEQFEEQIEKKDLPFF